MKLLVRLVIRGDDRLPVDLLSWNDAREMIDSVSVGGGGKERAGRECHWRKNS